jgi:archaellum component FlaG (FlaF/FlaG flagellin family)
VQVLSSPPLRAGPNGGEYMRRIGIALFALIIVATAAAVVTWSITKTSKPSHSSSSVAECMQAQLQTAIEQGGGLQAHYAHGYTFLIVNIGTQSCELRGYPYEVLFSTTAGVPVKVSISHQRTNLYAQPKAQRVVLRPGGVASFGISYNLNNANLQSNEPATCLAKLIDFRLPARLSSLFSEEFAVSIDVCAVGRRVEVTPVEGRSVPLA